LFRIFNAGAAFCGAGELVLGFRPRDHWFRDHRSLVRAYFSHWVLGRDVAMEIEKFCGRFHLSVKITLFGVGPPAWS
jgi:hypothetical protein